MTFWSSLDSYLETKAVPYSPEQRYIGTPGRRTPKDFQQSDVAIREGYEACAWVYRCVVRKQNMVASVPWVVRTYEDDRTFTDDSQHPAARRINNPTPRWVDRWYMMHRAAGFLSVTGNAPMGKFGDGSAEEEPTRWLANSEAWLKTESPIGVQPIEDGAGWLQSYEVVSEGGAKVEWDPMTIIHVMLPSLKREFWGMGELQALAASVDTDVSSHRWNLDTFGSGGMPSHLMIDYTISRDQLEQARTQIEDRFRQRGRQRTPWIVPGANAATGGNEAFRSGIELHKLGMSAQELDWLGGAGFTRDEIYAGLGFHPADASNERATHDNARVAKRQAWEEAAMPLLQAFSSAFTLRLLTRKERESGMVVAPDLREVRALQDARDSTAKAFRDLTTGGLSVADAARYTGIEVTELPEYETPGKAAAAPASLED